MLKRHSKNEEEKEEEKEKPISSGKTPQQKSHSAPRLSDSSTDPTWEGIRFGRGEEEEVGPSQEEEE